MSPKIKISYGLAILGSCFLLAVLLINLSLNSPGSSLSVVPKISSSSQLAQVAGVTHKSVSTFSDVSSNTSNVFQISSTISAGDTLVAIIHTDGIAVSSVTDSKGNSYSIRTSHSLQYYGADYIVTGYVANQLSSGDSVTVNYSASAYNYRWGDLFALNGIASSPSVFSGSGDFYFYQTGLSGIATVNVPTGNYSCIGTVLAYNSDSYSGSGWATADHISGAGYQSRFQNYYLFENVPAAGIQDPGGNHSSTGSNGTGGYIVFACLSADQAAAANPSVTASPAPAAAPVTTPAASPASAPVSQPVVSPDVVSAPAPVSGDIYISQNGAGAGNGADCADARPVSWLGSAANWGSGPGQIGPGTTVHLCGTITSPISVLGSGAAGNPIIVHFEPGANMTAPNWNAPVISVKEQNYVIIDGGTGGVIAATNNNSTSQTDSTGVYIENGSDVEVKNLTIKDMYVRTDPNDTNGAGGCGAGGGIVYYGNARSSAGGSDISIDHNTISNAGCGIMFTPSIGDSSGAYSSGGIKIFDNTISGNNWSIGFGVWTYSNVKGVDIYGNDITTSGAMWDEPNDVFHHNGMHIYVSGHDSTLSDLRIYGNYIHGDIGHWSTAYLFMEDPGAGTSGAISSTDVFNNLIVSTAGGASNGHIYIWTGGVNAFNNTLVALNYPAGIAIRTLSDSGTPVSDTIKNNIMYGFNASYSVPVYNVASGSYSANNITASGNLINVDPLFENISAGDFRLKSNSPAIGAGANLTQLCSVLPALCIDRNNITRPSSGPWDIGAYQYSTGGSLPPPSVVPSPAPASPPTVSSVSSSSITPI
ncbi:hypothetical protein KGQ27_02245, partial [Patescibacteria group bacterium]|nr:hypothetical protein [Patescibacteria group bacterium]MDE2011268.1 hypothetical protein [Patescibacteria group bacterium]MDE2233020.1 hypothetical protein [Patescibacteria group bacterium]